MIHWKITIFLTVLHYINYSSASIGTSTLQNYFCNPQLCHNGGQHIGCNKKIGEFGEECKSDVKIVPMTDDLKEYILELHNVNRAKIARGDIPRYARAERMGAVKWDDELAFLAELNVKTCKYAHDKCRNTYRFKYAGQNLALGYLIHETTPAEAVYNFTLEWFKEYKDANQGIIDQYTRPPGPAIGHFTLMVGDKLSHIGCAMVQYDQPLNGYTYKVFIFTCNYSLNNIYYQPIYLRGAVGSKCTTGNHTKYRGLCSDDENIISDIY